MKRLVRLLVFVGAISLASAQSAVPWHHPLYLANHGYWPKRVSVTVENDSVRSVAGEAVAVAIPGLAGEPVASLRVCRADGVELLFDLRDAQGRVKRTGAIATTDRLIFPAECAAKSAATVFVYAGNQLAWAVPDFLPAEFMNGDFEHGDNSPDGWMPVQADEQYRLTWTQSGGRDNSRCARTEVAAGAPATWVQWQQSGIPVVPGRTYQLRGWVRAENVAGNAGWYIHVNGEHPQLINRTLNAGSGTYDWKQVTATFTAPTNARNATVGTVLHGTGTAWFDEAEFKVVDSEKTLRI